MLLSRDNLTIVVDGRDIPDYEFDRPEGVLTSGGVVQLSKIGRLEAGSITQIFDSAEGRRLVSFTAPFPTANLLRCS